MEPVARLASRVVTALGYAGGRLQFTASRHWVAFFGAGVAGLYAGQVAMHAVLAPNERLPDVPARPAPPAANAGR